MPSCHVHPLPYHSDPSCLFAIIHEAPGAVMLDSGRPIATRGRYDLMSAWPLAELAPLPDESANRFFARLREAAGSLGPAQLPAPYELPFAGGLLGYLSYDLGRRIERIGEHARDDLGLPLASVGLYAWALISDHQAGTSQLVFHPRLDERERQRLIALFSEEAQGTAGDFKLLGKFRRSISASDYRQAIRRIQDYIQAGDCYQVNYSQRFQAACSGSPWPAYRALREACPTPFSGYLRLADGAILSLSPERFLKLGKGKVETRPIKGTRPRGKTPEEDMALAASLLASPKDRAENLMIVDLLRNDIGRSCQPGSVRVPELFALESYPNVHRLVSSVTGELAPGRTPSTCWKAASPAARSPARRRFAPCRSSTSWNRADAASTAAACSTSTCAARWTARSPSAPCWSGTARSVAGAAAASSPTRTGRTSTRKPWTRSGCCWKPWKEWPGQRPRNEKSPRSAGSFIGGAATGSANGWKP